jgi:hypothetical protein
MLPAMSAINLIGGGINLPAMVSGLLAGANSAQQMSPQSNNYQNIKDKIQELLKNPEFVKKLALAMQQSEECDECNNPSLGNNAPSGLGFQAGAGSILNQLKQAFQQMNQGGGSDNFASTLANLLTGGGQANSSAPDTLGGILGKLGGIFGFAKGIIS